MNVKATIYKCDGPKCKEFTENSYARKGWITLDCESATVAKGIYKNNSHQTIFNKSQDSQFDFCSTQCLINLLKREK